MIVSEPFPHMRFTADKGMYQSALSSFKKDAALADTHGRRCNIEIDNNAEVVGYLREQTLGAFKAFFPYLKSEYPSLKPSALQLRFLYSTNFAHSEPFSARDWHLDHGSKLLTGLWYMKSDGDDAGGDLIITDRHGGVETTIQYSSNTMILFPNLTTSWHKVSARLASNMDRQFVNIVLEDLEMVPLHDYKRDKNGMDYFRSVVNNYARQA